MTDRDNEAYSFMDELNEDQWSGEPDKLERCINWVTAIGLQRVDGLRVSAYLIELAKQNINGDITMDEVKKRLDDHYKAKKNRG